MLVVSRAALTGRLIDGRRITLRRPRLADYDMWSKARIADQRRIEPYWLTSTKSWQARHTVDKWLAEFLSSLRNDALGRTLHTVIDVDGRFSGQCNLEHIDRHPAVRTAELGIWVSSDCSGYGVGSAAIQLMVRHAFSALGIERVYAPISIDNAPAQRLAKRAGLIYEGVMRSYLDVGGRRMDHAVWALTATDLAEGKNN